MKKKDNSLYLLFGIFLLFAILAMVPYTMNVSGSLTYAKEAGATCTDSDFGQDYATQGQVTDNVDNWLTDWCESDTVLMEYYCSATGDIVKDKHVCAADTSCSSGACTEVILCTDSDDGRFYFEKGTLTYAGETYVDSCDDSDTVIEYYCTPIDEVGVSKSNCAYGCSDGACIHSN